MTDLRYAVPFVFAVMSVWVCACDGGSSVPVAPGDLDSAVATSDAASSSDSSTSMDASSQRDSSVDDSGATTTPGGGSEMDAGMVDPALCSPSMLRSSGCIPETREGSDAALCDGLDNDCDGQVDERCNCTPGAVQSCFAGHPGFRRMASDDSTFACTDGMQTCRSLGEFGGEWGPCTGGISPTSEICDGLDNDCNGCVDEIADCVPTDTCPGEGDARIPTPTPFSTAMLDGLSFYSGSDVMRWNWEVEGSPCDQMFLGIAGTTATPTNGQLSYTVTGSDTATPSIAFTLSGDYRVTMTVTKTDGTTFVCTFVIHVRAPGLRVELCWDLTGPTSRSNPVDIDLHLGQPGTDSRWFRSANDCYYVNCKSGGSLDWGYASSPIANCTGAGARGGFSGSCPNPRLDIDNISETSSYVAENINLDNPNDGDQFRVMVNYYSEETPEVAVRPLVNIYCGGTLVGSYGAAPDTVSGFMTGGGRSGDMWRVVDVVTRGSGDAVSCDLTPIRPADSGMGLYAITTDDRAF